MPTTFIAIDKGSDKWNGRSALQCYAMQCKSWENGLIVHNGIEEENEKLSICNVTSCLRLNLPDSRLSHPGHLIFKAFQSKVHIF